jgi:membrane protease subunit (stomatin/prohibitin family)
MGVIGNLQAYTQYETANSIQDAAKNPGGIAGVGAGMAVGYGMANQMSSAMNAPATGAFSGAQASSAPGGPPPLPTKSSFYLAIGGNQAGPFPIDELNAKIASGELKRDTLTWKQGMPQWLAAEQVAELAPLFASVPPPIPKG